VVKQGTVVFEVSELSKDIAYRALIAAGHKLPVKCKVVERDEPVK